MTAQDQYGASRPPFERLFCATDGTVGSIKAARQAMRIAPGAPATLVYVVDRFNAPSRQADYPAWVHTSREAAKAMLSAAGRELVDLGAAVDVDTSVEEGDLADALRYVTTSAECSVLLALGSGDEKEASEAFSLSPGITVRPVERVVEAVGCSVLVARCATDPDLFPAAITVGVDGSAPSIEAFRVAAAVAEQTGAPLSVLTAMGGKGPDLDGLRGAVPHISIDRLEPDHPAAALVQASVENGLVVVGNRGLHGLRSLGSVSARLVARSPVSVLVVRQP